VPIEDTIFGLEWFILLSGYMMVSLRDEPMPFDKDPLKEAPVSHAHAITGGRGHILNGPLCPAASLSMPTLTRIGRSGRCGDRNVHAGPLTPPQIPGNPDAQM